MCDRKIGPFDCCSVVQGDCLELMKQLPDGCVDAVITDPPYGIGADFKRAHSSVRRIYGESNWDSAAVCPTDEILRVGKTVVIWGGNHFGMLPSASCWLVWNKPERNFSLADAELAWTNLPGAVRVFDHPRLDGEMREHPTQKPLPLMLWVISKTDARIVVDPFCGSGTTLVAAKKLGRHFLGFEISPEYCEIAQKRLDAIDAQPNLFAPKPEQMAFA